MQESVKLDERLIGYRGSRFLEYTELSHFTALIREKKRKAEK